MQDFSIQAQHLETILKQHKLTMQDFLKIKEILKREPNLIELGIFSAMWSEHCSYKSSKIYLKDFPTQATWVLQGPGENAGVIDIGDNLAAIFKMESHNHPSFIEPNAGAATGVGGILRDIFTMGANPIINLNSIRFGNILDNDMRKKHIHLLHGVVEGIGHYGNCMGIPTIGGETSFESCYNGNILVNAFSLGIAKKDEIFYGKASGEGNPVMYVGSKTGRDGLGGAVMSSDSFDSNSKSLRPTVQIGDPFVEKLLLEACLEIFKEDLIIGIQDMGAAGLTSSSFEMASRSGSGMIMWLDKIPMREKGMNPYELMLSESQERMLLCAKKGCENRIKEIFAKYELSAEVVGEVRNTGKMELFWHGEKCVDLEIAPIVENAPILHRPLKTPTYLNECKTLNLDINNVAILAHTGITNTDLIQILLDLESSKNTFEKNQNTLLSNQNPTESMPNANVMLECEKPFYKTITTLMQNIFTQMLSSLDISDKAWIYNQYDSSIKASTIKGCGMGDSSIVSLKNYDSKKALSVSAKCNVRYCYLNPKIGAKIAVAQAGRNVALSGAKPLAITDCLNFGSPENPEVMYQFKEACEGIKEACKALHTPVVSGNVSLYNQTNNEAIYPTPSIVTVGVLEDYRNAIASHFVGNAREATIICRVGASLKDITKLNMYEKIQNLNLAGSLVQKIINANISGEVKEIDLELELRLWEFLEQGINTNLILSAKDVAQGGFAIAIAKMAIIGNKWINVLNSYDSIMQEMLGDKYDEKEGVKFLDDIQNIAGISLRQMAETTHSLALFSEEQSQVICQVLPCHVKSLCTLAKQKNLDFEILGQTDCMLSCNNLVIKDIMMPLDEARTMYFTSFEDIITKE